MLDKAKQFVRDNAVATAVVVSVLVVFALLWIATLSPSYQNCYDKQQPSYGYDNSDSGSYSFVRCEGVAIGNNGEFITAIATVALVFSTILLWVASRDAARVAERTLTELERPWFLITEVNHGAFFADENPRVEFVVRNFGKQVGILKGVRGGSGSERPTVNIDEIPQKEAATNQIGNMLAPIEIQDKHMLFSIPLKIAFTPQDKELLAKGVFEYVTRGVILYRGLSRQDCETGFCWRYDRITDRLVRHGGEKYNYAE